MPGNTQNTGKKPTPKPGGGYRPGFRPGYRPGFNRNQDGDGFVRVRMPKEQFREVLGTVEENYGSKLLIKCKDGHDRICRIPGKIRYKLRLKIGDIVLVKKWTVQENEKGDYLYRYTPAQIAKLKTMGILKDEDM
ncbi:MAG: translation initiation factor 1A [archaeon]